MSFISIDQKKLRQILSFCNQISLKKSDVEIFTTVLIKVDKKNLTISAVNSDIFFSESIELKESKVENEVSFLINTDLFTNSVNLLQDDIISIDINLEKNTIIIQGAKSKHVLRISSDKIHDFKRPNSQDSVIKAEILVNTQSLLDANKFADISVGNPRTVYQSEFLHVCYTLEPENSRIAIVATDRYRISKTMVHVDYTHVEEDISNTYTNFLIHPKSLSLLGGFITGEEQCKLIFEDGYLVLHATNKEIVLRYGEGKYPDYNKIIPQSFICNFDVNTSELLDGLKQVYFSAKMNSTNRSVKITLKPSEKILSLEAEGIDGFSSQSTVALNSYQGTQEDWNQNFNADYLIGYVSSLKIDDIMWEANPGKPSVLSPKGQKSEQLYLVSGLK